MTTETTYKADISLKLREAPPSVRPRDHQVAAWERMTAHYREDARPLDQRQAGLVVVPTGGGKTVLAAHWLLEHHIREGGRVLWLAHRRSLLRQAMTTFRNLGNMAFPKPALHMAVITGEDSRWQTISREHDVVFSSMQTAVLENNAGFLDLFVEESEKGVFVVVDEAHHAPAPSYARLLRGLKKSGCKLLGLTATPVRTQDEDQRRLVALFDAHLIYQITRKELVDRGILAVPAPETVKTRIEVEKEFTPEDYKYLERYGEVGPRVLERLARNAPRNTMIVDHYVSKKDTYGPTIVFAADTLHAATLAQEFRKKGIDADHVDYSRKDSDAVIEAYRKNRKPDVLVNVEMLTEGFDAPHTRTVFIARPTRSEGLLSQMIGRALRGPQSGGNDVAHLVTFVDTWEQFSVLDATYILGRSEDTERESVQTEPRELLRIPPELVSEAYRMMQSNVRGHFVGFHACLPHGWYAWNEAFEDDQQRRSVMVFDNQVAGFEALLAAHEAEGSIRDEIGEDEARALLRRFFADVPDPLPRWADVKALLDAKRKGCEIESYTFEEKKRFDPRVIAEQLVKDDVTPQAERKILERVWLETPGCRGVYRDDMRTFVEDVNRERMNLLAPPAQPIPPEVETLLPTAAPRAWPEGAPGHSLVHLRDSVLGVKKHFPNGAPLISELRWSKQPMPRFWGYCRYSDKSITINRVLNSPDVPLFVLEYLMFHEMLHADMPYAGHNKDFRLRETTYAPSPEAIDEAASRGIKPGAKSGAKFWYVVADRFLGTFNRYYLHKEPGTTMEIG